MQNQGGQSLKATWPVADNQYKLVLAVFTIGHSSVSGAQWLRSLAYSPVVKPQISS